MKHAAQDGRAFELIRGPGDKGTQGPHCLESTGADRDGIRTARVQAGGACLVRRVTVRQTGVGIETGIQMREGVRAGTVAAESISSFAWRA
jgi:hypothetical protein